MTRTIIQNRIRQLRDELENRYKYGSVKLANADGKPIPVVQLQNEMYKLIYKLSRME
jgi:hypothetical protein